jgi:hypothetical protein
MSIQKFSQFVASEAAKAAINERAEKHSVSAEVLQEVFDRGIVAWSEDTNKTPQQYAFNRVDSFIAGGLASKMDKDLKEALDNSSEDLKEGKRISDKVLYHVVKRDTQSVIRKHHQKEKAYYHANTMKHDVHKVENGRVVSRTDHNGRHLDASGHIIEGKHYIKARQALHNAHHEVSRQLAGKERDPELRRMDLHRAKKHEHASRVLEVLKTTAKISRRKKK